MNTKSNSISYTKKFKWAENAGENNQLKIVENEGETISQRKIRLLDGSGFKGQKDNQAESELIRASDFNFIFYSISKEFKTIQDLAITVNQTFNNVVSDLSGLDYRLKVVETWKSNHETKYDTLNIQVSDHETRVRALETWKPEISKQVSDHISNTNTMINSVRTKNNEQDQKLKELSDQNTVINSSMANFNAKVTQVENKTQALNVRVGNLNDNVQMVKDRVSFIKSDASRFWIDVPEKLEIDSTYRKFWMKDNSNNSITELTDKNLFISKINSDSRTTSVRVTSDQITMTELKVVDGSPQSNTDTITGKKIKEWDEAVRDIKKVSIDNILKRIKVESGWKRLYNVSKNYADASTTFSFSDPSKQEELYYIKIKFTNSVNSNHFTSLIYNRLNDIDYKQTFTLEVWANSDGNSSAQGDRQLITFRCHDGKIEIADAIRVYDASSVTDWCITEVWIDEWVTTLTTSSSDGGGHTTTR